MSKPLTHSDKKQTNPICALDDVHVDPINNDYSWCTYGDFALIMMNINGYINATELCKKEGKKLSSWLKTKAAKGLMSSVSSILNIPLSKIIIQANSVFNKFAIEKDEYIHPQLVIYLACWVSSRFIVSASEIVKLLYIYEEAIRMRKVQS